MFVTFTVLLLLIVVLYTLFTTVVFTTVFETLMLRTYSRLTGYEGTNTSCGPSANQATPAPTPTHATSAGAYIGRTYPKPSGCAGTQPQASRHQTQRP